MRSLLNACMVCLVVLAFGCNSEEAEPARGELGESCQARNDCEEGLACVRGACLPRSVGLKPTGKECYRVQCKSAEECCADFVAHSDCDQFKAACDAEPDDCLPFNRYCKCQRACEDDLCVQLAPACITEDHCMGGFLPYCASGRCVQCRTDTDCGTDGASCVDGACAPGCGADADCPMLHSCQEQRCVETGCSSNRECAFLLNDHRAVCDQKECRIGCSSSLECSQERFEVCEGGQCVFVGCASDLECRDAVATPGGPAGRAECR